MDQPVGEMQSVPVAVELRGVLRYSLTYMTGSVAYKAVALLAIPILARLLTPAELGLLDLAALIASIISLVAGIGLDTAIARFQPAEKAGRLWATAAVTLAAAALISALLGLALAETVSMAIVGSGSRASLIAAAVVYGVALAAIGFALTFVRLTDRPGAYSRYAFLIVMAQMVTAIGIAAFMSQPLPAVVWGWTGASVIGLIVLFWRQRMPLGGVDRELAARLVRFGGPLVPAAVVWIVGDLGIRAVIANAGTLAALGSYGIAARIVSLLGLFVAAFGLAWYPHVFTLSRDAVASTSQRALIQIVGGMGTAAILISTVAPEAVLLIAGPDYAEATQAVPGMAGSMVVLGVMTIVSAVVAMERGTTPVAIASGLGAVLQVALTFVLVPRLGLAGAAIGVGLGYGGAAIALLQRAHFLRLGGWHAATISMSASILIAALTLTQLLSTSPLLHRGVAGLLAAGLFVASCRLAWARSPDRGRGPD